jgi:hypothetical protein
MIRRLIADQLASAEYICTGLEMTKRLDDGVCVKQTSMHDLNFQVLLGGISLQSSFQWILVSAGAFIVFY